jgi:hypothetical protein
MQLVIVRTLQKTCSAGKSRAFVVRRSGPIRRRQLNLVQNERTTHVPFKRKAGGLQPSLLSYQLQFIREK